MSSSSLGYRDAVVTPSVKVQFGEHLKRLLAERAGPLLLLCIKTSFYFFNLEKDKVMNEKTTRLGEGHRLEWRSCGREG